MNDNHLQVFKWLETNLVVERNSVCDTEQYCRKIHVVDRNAVYLYFIFAPPKKKILHIKFLDINA
jgi:hypothetical protein